MRQRRHGRQHETRQQIAHVPDVIVEIGLRQEQEQPADEGIEKENDQIKEGSMS
jgi:hypothetical protein